MNDQGSGQPPDFDDEDEQRRAQQLQRAFMDRARRAVEREHEPAPRRVLHRTMGLVVAIVIAFGIIFVFDAFLSSMQKVMRMIDDEAARQQQEEVERQKKEPIPAYVVPAS